MNVHDWFEKDEEWRESYSKYGENAVERKIRDSNLWIGCEEFSDEEDKEEVSDNNAPENWKTTAGSQESSNEADLSDDESKSGSTSSSTITAHQTIRRWLSYTEGKTEQQQGARNHRRQQSSFEMQTVKRAKIGQS